MCARFRQEFHRLDTDAEKREKLLDILTGELAEDGKMIVFVNTKRRYL
jgi:superfamily II DNA/RNA helicase